MLIGAIRCRTGVVEVQVPIVAILVGAGHCTQRVFATDAFTGHSKGLIGQTTSTGVLPSHPTCLKTLCPYWAARFEGPGSISAQLGRYAKFAKNSARLLITRDNQ